MADAATPVRLEPKIEPPPAPSPEAVDAELRAAVESATPQTPVVTEKPSPRRLDAPGLDQLSRVEEKAARIEEKYARTEALLMRVEDKVEKAAGRMGEAARQADLAAMRGEVAALANRVRRLPGFGSLLVVGLLASLLGAALTLAALRYGVPGVLPAVLPR